MEKITSATLTSLGEDFHRAFEVGLAYELKKLGRVHPLYIRGRKKKASAGVFVDMAPGDTRMLLGDFQVGGRAETQLAIEGARAALSDWNELGWEQRISFLRKAAELMTQRQFRLAALLCLDAGKTRFEAITEVTESIDLILYYCKQMELHHGYGRVLSESDFQETRSVLKPYGVWGVIAPFSSPLALATGMITAALLGGNTIVFKPASDTPLVGWALQELLNDSGLPAGVVNFVTGPGAEVGAELASSSSVDGLAFSGSRAVGLDLSRRFPESRLRPCIASMGGNNPVIVMPSADLEDATEGVMRSAFSMGGQNCSACSRVYLHPRICAAFVELFLEKLRRVVVGDPTRRETFLGPLINQAAVERFDATVALGNKEGRILHGGGHVEALEHGFYVEPTLVEGLTESSSLLSEEFSVPVLAVAEADSLDEAVSLANRGEHGLTAGIYSREEHEQESFFDTIHAGVTYCNQRSDVTTGAWPGIHSFGGWNQSGSSGKGAMGPYYLAQFMREQSQTRGKG